MTKDQLKQKGFPINLLIEGKSCLVVGGGKVALRKIDTCLTPARKWPW